MWRLMFITSYHICNGNKNFTWPYKNLSHAHKQTHWFKKLLKGTAIAFFSFFALHRDIQPWEEVMLKNFLSSQVAIFVSKVETSGSSFWYEDRLGEKSNRVQYIYLVREQIDWENHSGAPNSPDSEETSLKNSLWLFGSIWSQVSLGNTSIKATKIEVCIKFVL